VIAHNKTLPPQLCNDSARSSLKRVEYFVSYYDYYQPEAYVPSRDLYIEKDSAINQEVDACVTRRRRRCSRAGT